MNRSILTATFAALMGASLLISPSSAQDDELKPRQLAPGVLTVVAPDVEVDEAFTNYRPLLGIDTKPFAPNLAPLNETLHERVKKVIFRHDVWCYEISYKPLRKLKVEIPQPSGKMQEKIVWFLMYRVRNLGSEAALGNIKSGNLTDVGDLADVTPAEAFDVVPKDALEPASLHGRFFPSFVLEGWASYTNESEYERKAYLDRVMPSAAKEINRQEDPAIRVYNSVEISQLDIPVSTATEDNGVWGVATWEDVDPRIDYVSVFVQGLTNAHQVIEKPDGETVYKRKTLQLNFWRPGDVRMEDLDDIRVGVPLVDTLREQVDITARYNLPGPEVFVSRFNPKTNRSEELFEADAMLDVELNSRALARLQAGRLPTSVIEGFQEIGMTVPSDSTLSEKAVNRVWEFSAEVGGETQYFRVQFRPRYWERVGRKIQYLDRLEYMWIYR